MAGSGKKGKEGGRERDPTEDRDWGENAVTAREENT